MGIEHYVTHLSPHTIITVTPWLTPLYNGIIGAFAGTFIMAGAIALYLKAKQPYGFKSLQYSCFAVSGISLIIAIATVATVAASPAPDLTNYKTQAVDLSIPMMNQRVSSTAGSHHFRDILVTANDSSETTHIYASPDVIIKHENMADAPSIIITGQRMKDIHSNHNGVSITQKGFDNEMVIMSGEIVLPVN